MSEEVRRESAVSPDLKMLKRMMIKRFTLMFVVLALILFLPAWTPGYWQGWIYIFILLVPMSVVSRYMYRRDPALLERRMRMKERQQTQKLLIMLSSLAFLPVLVVPGFDVRFGWSNVPWVVVVIAEILALFGYLIVALVFRANSYASRIIEVEKEQKVITTGPYAIVRHPMYLGMIVLFIFTPLALGSYWAMIPVLLLVPLVSARIGGEEKELLENLAGYKEYVLKTKYRLLPGLW